MCKVLKALFHRTPPPQELLERTAAAEQQLLEAGTEKNMLEAELSRLPITSSGRTIRVRLEGRGVLGFAGDAHENGDNFSNLTSSHLCNTLETLPYRRSASARRKSRRGWTSSRNGYPA